jgi:hypothetical protein
MATDQYKQATVDRALRDLGNYRVLSAQHIAAEGPPDEFSGALLLSLGLRESLLKNVNSPSGTDRGWAQINDHWHAEFLRSEPGCPVGSWQAQTGKTAIEKGYCPRFTPACLYALDVLKDGANVARDHGVEKDQVIRFALAAYNAGTGGALKGFREGDFDKYTTGGDYGEWVLAHRRKVLVFLKEHPNWKF